MRIIVVRHGQAEPKLGWNDPDDTRPLVARGRRQAELLERVVGRRRPDRVLSSPALRCVQTVRPLAESHGLQVELTDALATDAGPEAHALCTELATSEPPDATVMLCTHRETLVDLLPLLTGGSAVGLPRPPPGAKGSAWILGFGGDGRLEELDYRPPAA